VASNLSVEGGKPVATDRLDVDLNEKEESNIGNALKSIVSYFT